MAAMCFAGVRNKLGESWLGKPAWREFSQDSPCLHVETEIEGRLGKLFPSAAAGALPGDDKQQA